MHTSKQADQIKYLPPKSRFSYNMQTSARVNSCMLNRKLERKCMSPGPRNPRQRVSTKWN